MKKEKKDGTVFAVLTVVSVAAIILIGIFI